MAYATYSSPQFLHLGRSSPTSPHCSATLSKGNSVSSPGAVPTPGWSSRETLLLRSTRGVQLNRIEQQIVLKMSRNLNRGESGEARTVVPLASQRDYPIFDISSYEGEGPIELPPREVDIDPLAIPDASPTQVVASVLLTGAIVVLLVRSLRRRAARAKEMQFRSSGVATSKSMKEQARKAMLANLMKTPEVPKAPPSPAETVFGAVVAGAIALGLYKFTSTVESGFTDKVVSANYSIRNLTITVRTIITGLCYLATFVFAANSIGLALYSLQLLLGFFPSKSLPPPSESVLKDESTTDSESKENVEAEDLSEE